MHYQSTPPIALVLVLHVLVGVQPSSAIDPSGTDNPPPLTAETLPRRLHRTEEWMQRFSDQLQKAFTLYTQSGSVRQQMEESLAEGRLEVESVEPLGDGEFRRRRGRLREKIQAFIDAKVISLRSLTKTAEEVSKEFDFENLTLSQAQNGVDCPSHSKRIDAESVYSAVKKRGRVGSGSGSNEANGVNGKGSSAVHMSLEAYKCGKRLAGFKTVSFIETTLTPSSPDPNIVRDYEWTSSPKIQSSFITNYMEDPSLSRQYIGTYSGLTRLHPAVQWEQKPERYTVDLFDPRFRPWFIGAESAPKDVLFLID